MTTAQCACGAVVLELEGTAIASATCYCDTCQEGARRIEALPNAPAVRDPFGGAEYVLYRKDRVAYQKGQELVKSFKLDPKSGTNRVYATCCNSAMMMTFDRVLHWIPVYRARLGSNAPPVEMRMCTNHLPDAAVLPNDVPTSGDYPPAFLMRLLAAGVAMLFRQ